MHTDLYGKTCFKLGLHHHSTRSDGRLTPEEIAEKYCSADYDAIAITDHWVFGEESTLKGFPVLSGCEYHTGIRDGNEGVYHILCLMPDREPQLDRTMSPQQIIDGIHAAGGLAVLAHPAWSLNSPEKIKALRDLDGIEIFNTVSERGNSRRGDSSLLVDLLASEGYFYPLLAADDSHFYEASGNFADSCTAFIVVSCDTLAPNAIKDAIKAGNFYASTGPEIHMTVENGIARVDCSEATEIVFLSNFVYMNNRVITGENLTSGEYTIQPGETYIRAYVTDSLGRRAWSCPVKL